MSGATAQGSITGWGGGGKGETALEPFAWPGSPHTGIEKHSWHSCCMELQSKAGSLSSQHHARGRTDETTTLASRETSHCRPHPASCTGSICSLSFWSKQAQEPDQSQRGFVPKADPLPFTTGRVIRTGVKSGAGPRWERCGNTDKAGLFPLRRREARQERHTNRHN